MNRIYSILWTECLTAENTMCVGMSCDILSLTLANFSPRLTLELKCSNCQKLHEIGLEDRSGHKVKKQRLMEVLFAVNVCCSSACVCNAMCGEAPYCVKRKFVFIEVLEL